MALFKSHVLALSVLFILVQVAPRRKTKSFDSEIWQKQQQKIVLKLPVIAPLKRHSNVVVNPVVVDCKSTDFKNAIRRSKSEARCKPRKMVVYLESSSQGTLIPNAVIAKKCAGMCTATQKCIATKTSVSKHYVREIKNNQVSCTVVDVIEEEACKCDCPQKPSDCKAFSEEYDRDSCRCICKEGLKQECELRKRKLYYWDEKECECMCRQTTSCTTGTEWNPVSCRCAKINLLLN